MGIAADDCGGDGAERRNCGGNAAVGELSAGTDASLSRGRALETLACAFLSWSLLAACERSKSSDSRATGDEPANAEGTQPSAKGFIQAFRQNPTGHLERYKGKSVTLSDAKLQNVMGMAMEGDSDNPVSFCYETGGQTNSACGMCLTFTKAGSAWLKANGPTSFHRGTRLRAEVINFKPDSGPMLRNCEPSFPEGAKAASQQAPGGATPEELFEKLQESGHAPEAYFCLLSRESREQRFESFISRHASYSGATVTAEKQAKLDRILTNYGSVHDNFQIKLDGRLFDNKTAISRYLRTVAEPCELYAALLKALPDQRALVGQEAKTRADVG